LRAQIADYRNTDQNDESLRKWKESLGIGSGTTIGDASDPRKVIIVSLGLEVRFALEQFEESVS
jgi:Rho GDP-dissociation inhibitor